MYYTIVNRYLIIYFNSLFFTKKTCCPIHRSLIEVSVFLVIEDKKITENYFSVIIIFALSFILKYLK